MSKHTPGPWYVDEDPRDGMEWNRHICSSATDRICFMAHSNGRSPERDEANARLIAAAPETAAERDRLKEVNADLLEAMRKIIKERNGIEGWRPSGAFERNCLLKIKGMSDIASAAIAKAEGR